MGGCPICGKPMKKWYSLGGKESMGCSDITCEGRVEVKGEPKTKVRKQRLL